MALSGSRTSPRCARSYSEMPASAMAMKPVLPSCRQPLAMTAGMQVPCRCASFRYAFTCGATTIVTHDICLRPAYNTQAAVCKCKRQKQHLCNKLPCCIWALIQACHFDTGRLPAYRAACQLPAPTVVITQADGLSSELHDGLVKGRQQLGDGQLVGEQAGNSRAANGRRISCGGGVGRRQQVCVIPLWQPELQCCQKCLILRTARSAALSCIETQVTWQAGTVHQYSAAMCDLLSCAWCQTSETILPVRQASACSCQARCCWRQSPPTAGGAAPRQPAAEAQTCLICYNRAAPRHDKCNHCDVPASGFCCVNGCMCADATQLMPPLHRTQTKRS